MQASEPNVAQRLYQPWLKDKLEAAGKAAQLKPTRPNRALRRQRAALKVNRRLSKAAAWGQGVLEFLRIEAEGIPHEHLSSHQRRALAEQVAAIGLAA